MFIRLIRINLEWHEGLTKIKEESEVGLHMSVNVLGTYKKDGTLYDK